MTTARDLTNHLAALLRKEQSAMADFLVALAVFDREERWREMGHTSLFYFLRRELGLSAGAAQYRKSACELVRRSPAVERALREGKLCLSSVIELAKVLTRENEAEVLPRFFGVSSREAAFVAAAIRPVEDPPVREVVTSLRALTSEPAPEPPLATCSPPRTTGDAPAAGVRAHEVLPATIDEPAPSAPGRARATVPQDDAEPLDAERARGRRLQGDHTPPREPITRRRFPGADPPRPQLRRLSRQLR